MQRSESHFTSTATGNKPQAVQAIDEDEEDAFFEAREFYDSNPARCTSKSWDEIRKLRWGDVHLQRQNGGQEVLVWLAELGTKTRHGQERGHQRAFQLKIYATNTARCPVSFYKNFPQSPTSGNECIRITTLLGGLRHNQRSNEEVWYVKAPHGKNKIQQVGKFLSTAEKNAGLHREGKKIANHSA